VGQLGVPPDPVVPLAAIFIAVLAADQGECGCGASRTDSRADATGHRLQERVSQHGLLKAAGAGRLDGLAGGAPATKTGLVLLPVPVGRSSGTYADAWSLTQLWSAPAAA